MLVRSRSGDDRGFSPATFVNRLTRWARSTSASTRPTLFRERKLAANTVNQRVGTLRFFFIKTLKKTWGVDETPYPKRVIRLPRILIPEEVGRLIDCATTPLYRTILVMLYATEVCRGDMLSPKLLQGLAR